MPFISLNINAHFFALSDTAIGKDKSYKQMKAKLGMRKVRPWKWMPFKNPARKDDLVLYHWRRATEKGQDYAFAKFNKKLEVWKPLRFILNSDVKCLIFVLFHISKQDFTHLISPSLVYS